MFFGYIIDNEFGRIISRLNNDIFIGSGLQRILFVAIFGPYHFRYRDTLEGEVEFETGTRDDDDVMKIFGVDEGWNWKEKKRSWEEKSELSRKIVNQLI